MDTLETVSSFEVALTELLERTTHAPFQVDAMELVLTPKGGGKRLATFRLVPGVRGLLMSSTPGAEVPVS